MPNDPQDYYDPQHSIEFTWDWMGSRRQLKEFAAKEH